MAHGERLLCGKESIEDKIRKYTKPHPVVTSHLRNNASKFLYQSNTSGFNATSRLGFPSLHYVPQNYPVFEETNNVYAYPVVRNVRYRSNPTDEGRNNSNRKRSHSCSAATTNNHGSYGKHARNELYRDTNSIGKYSRLTHQIESYTIDNSQSEQLLDKKLKLCSALLCVIQRQFPVASLHLVGSSCNGFASNSSDADFCIMINHSRNIDQSNEARYYLRTIEKLIQPMTSLERLHFIGAKVPILKFLDTISGCDCDINVNNSVGIRNTHLLRTYSKLDYRVRPLVMVVKMWGKVRGINDASQGTLSSYSLVLMVIHFLQCGCEPPVLPSLQQEYPQYFQDDSNLDELSMFEPADTIPCNSSSNTESIGELLVEFFNYFAEIFVWDLEIISVRLGSAILKKNQCEFKNKYISIEEPFNLSNTAHAVYDLPQFNLIIDEFDRANVHLKEKVSLENII